MTQTIPLIRAGAAVPLMRWMAMHDRPVQEMLQEVGLGYLAFIEPTQPVPLRDVVGLLVNATRREGPDIGCRVVSETTLQELAFIGRVALGAGTPAQALERVARVMPYHSSHETLALRWTPAGLEVSEGWAVRFDAEALHVIHQFFAAIMQMICHQTLAPEPLLEQIEMAPHPEHGLSHLTGWFHRLPVLSRDRSLRIVIGAETANRPFFKVARDRSGGAVPAGIEPLTVDGGLSGSARAVVALHLLDGKPTIDRLARAAGLSRRTLQRRLADEGTCYTDLLEDVRRTAALQYLSGGSGSIDDVAARVGYSRQSTLTRAVRRWSGQTPTTLRRGAK